MIVEDFIVEIIQGDLDPDCKIYLQTNDTAVSLVGKTVSLIIKNSYSVVSEREITPSDVDGGEITLLFEGEETATTGWFNIFIRTVDNIDDRPRTFPTKRNLKLKVVGI